MIKFKQTGKFRKTANFLKKLGDGNFYDGIGVIAEKGVTALQEATPVDTGKTAASWSYTIKRTKETVTINFKNSNVNEGVNVAMLIQYGHGTPQGIYIEGIDYINPALKPIFEEMGNKVWKEVTHCADG